MTMMMWHRLRTRCTCLPSSRGLYVAPVSAARSFSPLPPPPLPLQHHTFALFKPDGYLSQFVHNGRRKQRQRLLGELFDRATHAATPHTANVPSALPRQFPPGLMPVGRLDEMSEGLLLVTTDGALSHRVNAGGVEKEYYCQLDGAITEDARRALAAGGLEISTKSGGGNGPWRTRPCRVAVLEDARRDVLPPRSRRVRDDHRPSSWVSVTIREGRNRQVRRMTAAVGYPTLRLVRVRVGGVHLMGGAVENGTWQKQWQPGEIRELKGKELSALNALIDTCQPSAPDNRQE